MTYAEVETRVLSPKMIIDARAVREAIASREDAERKLSLANTPGRPECMNRNIYEKQRANAETMIQEQHELFNAKSHAYGYRRIDQKEFECRCL